MRGSMRLTAAEDQQRINTFSKLNNRRTDQEEIVEQLKARVYHVRVVNGPCR